MFKIIVVILLLFIAITIGVIIDLLRDLVGHIADMRMGWIKDKVDAHNKENEMKYSKRKKTIK